MITAAVILAAGESSRFGQPKQLLLWKGKPLLLHVVETALGVGLSPVVVVLGAVVDSIVNLLSGFDVDIVVNADWKTGQSSSIRAGVEVLPMSVKAALFLLADQPHVSSGLIKEIIRIYDEIQPPYIVPVAGKVRGNPVLFGRVAFKDLMNLKGDSGGRELFPKYDGLRLQWDNPGILFDIDSQEDYQKLLDGE